MKKSPSTAILSLGTNIEPRQENLAAAREKLNALPGTAIVGESSIIETDPVDVPEEFSSL